MPRITTPVEMVSWKGNRNLTPMAQGDNQEWSIDLDPDSHSGTYWHIWSTPNGKTILSCYPGDNSVRIPNGDLQFSGSASIGYQGTNAYYKMIKFRDNTSDTYGNGIYIGGGGLTVIGGGESADAVNGAISSGSSEQMIVANDGAVEIWSNCQNGAGSAKKTYFNADGSFVPAGLVKLNGTSCPAAGTSTDFFTIGINNFNNGGRLSYKDLSQTKSWLGISSSDRRLKSDVKPLGDEAIEFIEKLEPCVYVMNGKRQVGLIAQDVHEADPWNTCMAYGTDGSDGEGLEDWERMEDGSPTWKLDYDRIIAPLVTAVQNLMARVESLEADLAEARASAS